MSGSSGIDSILEQGRCRSDVLRTCASECLKLSKWVLRERLGAPHDKTVVGHLGNLARKQA